MTRPPSHDDIESLYRLHGVELRGYLYRRAGPAGADLLGEVFVVALRRRAELPDPDRRRAWLFGVARRLLLAAERDARRRRQAELERADVDGADPGAVPEERTDRVTAVRLALSSLGEPDRELIRLTEWERLGIDEAAAVLGLRPGTARVRLHRARRRLAQHPALLALIDPGSRQEPSSRPFLRGFPSTVGREGTGAP